MKAEPADKGRKRAKVDKPEIDRSKPRDVLRVEVEETENVDEALARQVSRPQVPAARAIQQWEGGDSYELNALVQELGTQISAVNSGDLTRAEGMLVAQAHTLDQIFNTLAMRSYRNIKEGYLDAGERYLRLGLKAQSQCRATLETLATIKNPPILFAKQANIAAMQQVNNGVPRAGEGASAQTKLSGGSNELLPDARASTFASRVDPALEAVGEIDRTQVGGREGSGEPKRLPRRVA